MAEDVLKALVKCEKSVPSEEGATDHDFEKWFLRTNVLLQTLNLPPNYLKRIKEVANMSNNPMTYLSDLALMDREDIAEAGFPYEQFGIASAEEINEYKVTNIKQVLSLLKEWVKVNDEVGGVEPIQPKFRFYDGVLHRDFIDKVLKFSKKTLNYAVMVAAFRYPPHTKISWDELIGVDRKGDRQLYDAARSLNGKIFSNFGINDFFTIHKSEEYIERSVE